MKNHLTGSLPKFEQDADSESNADSLDILFDTLVDSLLQYETEKEVYTLHPPEEGFDAHWFIDTKTRFLQRFSKSTQVEIIEDYDDDNYLCYVGGMTVIVNKNKVKTRIID